MENIDESYKSMLMNYSNCCKIISHYEDSINQLYNNLDEKYQKCEGYIIDFIEYEKLKEDLNYKIFKNNNEGYFDEIILKIITLESEHNSKEELKRFEQIKIKSYQELINLLNNNKYIFINKSLWTYTCKNGKENESGLNYWVNKSKFYFFLEDENYANFNPNKNIIDKANFIINEQTLINNKELKNIDNNEIYTDLESHDKYPDNINQKIENNNIGDKLENMIDIMFEYYLFEVKEYKKYKESKGYLIDKKLIDQWKKSINYEKIKEKYFVNNSENTLSSELKNKILIEISELNKKIENNVCKIKSLEFNTLEEFKLYSDFNSFVLINRKLYELMNNKKEIKENEIEYILEEKNNKISFKYKNSFLSFYINKSNIIFSSLDYNLFFLIKYYIYQKKLINDIVKGITKIIIPIDKDFVDKYKKYFNIL